MARKAFPGKGIGLFISTYKGFLSLTFFIVVLPSKAQSSSVAYKAVKKFVVLVGQGRLDDCERVFD